MAITIPNLRTLTIDHTAGSGPSTTTVPSNKTWFIYCIEQVNTGIASLNQTIYLTISGVQHILAYKNNALVQNTQQLNPKFIMKDGDSITVEAYLGIKIAYWEVETDFGVNYLDLPNYNSVSFNNTLYNTWQTVATVPANETWAVPFTSFYLTSVDTGVPTGYSVTHRLTKDGIILALDIGTVNFYNPSNQTKSAGFAITRYKIQLSTGDTLESIYNVTSGSAVSASLTTKIAYWILETDF